MKLPYLAIFLLAAPLVLEALAGEKAMAESVPTTHTEAKAPAAAPATATPPPAARSAPARRKVPASVAPWFM